MTAAILQAILALLGALPLAVQTIQGIRDLLSKDPSVPADLAAIFADTELDNTACITRATAWLAANPV